MNERVYRFYYIQRGNTEWEFEDFYERSARTAAFIDARENIVACAFAEGTDDFLPDKPAHQDQSVVAEIRRERIEIYQWDAP